MIGRFQNCNALIPTFSRRQKERRGITVLMILLVAQLGSCAPLPADHPPVPPLRAEQVPAPPRASVTLIWQPGHYDWNGFEYTWIAGEWIDRAGRASLWQDGYWRQVNGRSVWVPAHWL